MADLPPPGQVTCPLCDKVCTIPAQGSVDSLPNNLHALHIVELNKKITTLETTVVENEITITSLNSANTKLNSTNSTLNNILENGSKFWILKLVYILLHCDVMRAFIFFRLWCVTCKGLAKPTCHEGEKNHKMTDFGKDVEEFNDWLVEWETYAHQGIGKVDHGQGHLVQEKEQLMVKLKAVEVKMEEGEGLRQKLIEIVTNCEEMKQLPPESKATVFMRTNLRQAMEDTKQEVKKAKEFVNGLGIPDVVAEEKKLMDKVEVIDLGRLIFSIY